MNPGGPCPHSNGPAYPEGNPKWHVTTEHPDKVSTMQLPVKPFYLSVATWTREMREQGVVHEYSFASLFHNANGSHCTAKMECPT